MLSELKKILVLKSIIDTVVFIIEEIKGVPTLLIMALLGLEKKIYFTINHDEL